MTESGAQRPSDRHVQSFARGLQVIRSFDAAHPAQTLSEVAAITGLTRAGARRILLTLQGLGYVQTEGRHFRLSPRILDLGFAYLSSQPLWHLAEPVMQRLAQTVHESCSMAVLDGSEIVYLLRVPARKIMSINLGVGSRLPAYCTSMGRVLLGGLGEQERLAILLACSQGGAELPARTAATLTTVEAVNRAISQARQQGWCLVVDELEQGLTSLAAPVEDRSGRVAAALNISTHSSGPREGLLAQALPALRQAAKDISELLRRTGA
jgi:IclR family pca regulon transcriptional regulator